MIAWPAAAQQPLTPADRQVAMATVWSEARYNFAWWDRVRSDWDSAFRANLPGATTRNSDAQFLRALRRFTALLGDAQTTVTAPPLAGRLGRVPIELRGVAGRALVMDYVENNEMRIVRPERLAEVVAVQGIPAEQWIRDSVLPEIGAAGPEHRWRLAVAAMLDGERSTAVHVQIRLPDGAIRGASLTRSIAGDARWPFEPPPVEVERRRDGIVVVRLNSFADPSVVDRFDRALPNFERVRGLVIDLRENGGGDSENGYQILARLIERPFVTVARRTPVHRPAQIAAGDMESLMGWTAAPPDTVQPREDRPCYGGRVAVLVSGRTAGAAEDFVVAVRNAGRGPSIGDPTAGAAGRRIALPLPRGWLFHVTVTRHAFPDGTEFVGTGIAPELSAPETVADLQAGRDAALERALEYLKGR